VTNAIVVMIIHFYHHTQHQGPIWNDISTTPTSEV